MKRTSSLMVHGALAGLCGAACMTALRMAAHRAGWITQMTPQAVEVWAQAKSPLRPHTAATHHVADQLLHLGYGAVFGALYATSLGRTLLGRTLLGRTPESPRKQAVRGLVRRAVRGQGSDVLRSPIMEGIAFGVPLWAFGTMVVFPALDIAKPAWRSSLLENAVNIAAHVLYGTVTALATGELETQKLTQPRLLAWSRHARVG